MLTVLLISTPKPRARPGQRMKPVKEKARPVKSFCGERTLIALQPRYRPLPKQNKPPEKIFPIRRGFAHVSLYSLHKPRAARGIPRMECHARGRPFPCKQIYGFQYKFIRKSYVFM